jgi:hypothetical protein
MPDRKKPAMIRAQVLDEHGKPTESKTINVSDIRITGKQRSTLTSEQILRAQILWDRIGRTARTDLDKDGWVQMFTRESDPESELQVWTAIASTVEELWNDTKFSKKLTKAILVKAVIGVRMGMVDVPSQCRGITDEQVAVIRPKLDGALGDSD